MTQYSKKNRKHNFLNKKSKKNKKNLKGGSSQSNNHKAAIWNKSETKLLCHKDNQIRINRVILKLKEVYSNKMVKKILEYIEAQVKAATVNSSDFEVVFQYKAFYHPDYICSLEQLNDVLQIVITQVNKDISDTGGDGNLKISIEEPYNRITSFTSYDV
jgi:hypothetical protein